MPEANWPDEIHTLKKFTLQSQCPLWRFFRHWVLRNDRFARILFFQTYPSLTRFWWGLNDQWKLQSVCGRIFWAGSYPPILNTLKCTTMFSMKLMIKYDVVCQEKWEIMAWCLAILLNAPNYYQGQFWLLSSLGGQ